MIIIMMIIIILIILHIIMDLISLKSSIQINLKTLIHRNIPNHPLCLAKQVEKRQKLSQKSGLFGKLGKADLSQIRQRGRSKAANV